MKTLAPAPFIAFRPVPRPPEPPPQDRTFFVVTGLLGVAMVVLCVLALVSAAAVFRSSL